MFKQVAAKLAAQQQELQQADAAARATGDDGAWPDAVAAVYSCLEDSAAEGAGLVAQVHDQVVSMSQAFSWSRGLAESPDLLGRCVPALLRDVSGRLSRLMPLHKESQEPAGREEHQAGELPGSPQHAAAAGVSPCAFVLCDLVHLACSGVVAATHAGLPAMLQRPEREQLLRSVAGPEQLRALAAAADVLGVVLAVPSREGAAPAGSWLNEFWHGALRSAMTTANACAVIARALVAAIDGGGGAAAQPAVGRRLADSLQKSGLVEATCRMLLAPKLLQVDPDGRADGHTAIVLWNGAVLQTLKAIHALGYAACDGPAGAEANAVPAELCSALTGPATQRFMRAVSAAALGQAPSLDAVPRTRRRELLALLPSTAEAAALLLSDGTQPLPPGLLQPGACEGIASLADSANYVVANVLFGTSGEF